MAFASVGRDLRMMRYNEAELAKYARILHVVSVVLVIVVLLGGAVLSLSAAFYVAAQGYGAGPAVAAFAVCFIAVGAIAALVVAPLRLTVEVALCAARIEENTRAGVVNETSGRERAA
jgi:hypothetical protein